MLRIIAGKYRSIKIMQPDLKITRPTKNRIIEAIFSSIQFEVKNSTFLDLFSGSGIFVFEAISREAKKAVAVEKNAQAVSILKLNKQKLKITNIEIIHLDALLFLKNEKNNKYNFIFLDPPYEKYHLYNEALTIISEKNLLSSDGKIIIETNCSDKVQLPKNFFIKKIKKYSNISVLFIIKN